MNAIDLKLHRVQLLLIQLISTNQLSLMNYYLHINSKTNAINCDVHMVCYLMVGHYL